MLVQSPRVLRVLRSLFSLTDSVVQLSFHSIPKRVTTRTCYIFIQFSFLVSKFSMSQRSTKLLKEQETNSITLIKLVCREIAHSW